MTAFGVQELGFKSCSITAVWLLLFVSSFGFGNGVKLDVQGKFVTMDNGVVQVTLSNPEGLVDGIRYNGIDNLLEVGERNRGYWDVFWNEPGGNRGVLDMMKMTDFRIIVQNPKQVEISFTRKWNPSLKGSVVPLNVDKRFIMLEGSHGFYTYAIYEHLNGWPDFNINETRIAFKLNKKLFHYMAVDEKRQRAMPSPEDRQPGRGKKLAYPEAVHLDNPIEPQFAGEVDDKYQYSCKSEDIKVHGWATNVTDSPPVGFWQITPSNEFRSGGPFKQELTSHCGPTSLSVFISPHYMGQRMAPQFRNGEYWKKVFGPVFIYLNAGRVGTTMQTLWGDANNQLKSQTQIWPYNFPVSDDFPGQRGSVRGRLLVQDRYINKEAVPAGLAHVGLALPGVVGSWQFDSKGYQFWTTTGPDGHFTIDNIRVGTYNLYATVPGFIGDYRADNPITIKLGSTIDLGDFIYVPPRDGPTLWEIGYPDRSAEEFFIPDPDPNYVNPLFLNRDRFRQYGLWERYAALHPTEDIVYTINLSDYKKDWFYAHFSRRTATNTYLPTTWQIKFNLNNVGHGIYKLRIALASAAQAEVQVRFNNLIAKRPHFTTGLIGQDNAIARHAIRGTYWLFNIDVKNEWLVQGENTIFLTQTRRTGSFEGVMYDYIRFEGIPA